MAFQRNTERSLKTSLLVAASVMLMNVNLAQAAPVSVTDYTAAPSANGGEEVVRLFDTYDFSVGASALNLSNDTGAVGPSVGDLYTGYYQSFITKHMLGASIVPSANLNSGYELTYTAVLQQEIIAISGSGTIVFGIGSGLVNLYLNPDLDHDFASDSAFNAGDLILSASVSGNGAGTFIPTLGIGSAFADLDIDSFDSSIFSGSSIDSASLSLTMPVSSGDFSTVMGHDASGSFDFLSGNDGTLQVSATPTLTPVPAPAALWLLLSGLSGIVFARRFSHKSDQA